MSQAGDIDVIGTHPEIPTTFVTNDGDATPIANTLEILGTVVPAGSIPVETTGSGNTVTIEVQITQESAISDPTKIGLASFDSSAFDVDANGFVTLTGGSAATNINVDAHTAPGTDPVVPNAGAITMTGAQVASGVVGANVIRTDSLAANTVTIEIQRSAAVAVSDLTKNGVVHFDSSEFIVDSNGFVSLTGGGLAIDSIGTQTGTNPIVPNGAGLVTINGAVVAAGTNPVRSDGTGANTMAIEVQISQAIASSDATKIGLCNFNSSSFSVDANGFVSLAGGGLAIDSISPNSGTDPIVPDAAGKVSILGSGSITTVGSLNTETIQLTGLTNHAILVGAGTSTITKVGPSSTSGQVLQSAGASADPAFSTATYPSTATGTGTLLRADGTNWTATTTTYPNTNAINTLLYASSANVMSALAASANGVLISSATNVPSWLAAGTTGQLLIATTSNPPSWGSFSALFTWVDTSGTVTASANTGYFITTTCTSTLPASPSQGDRVRYVVDTSNILTITANTGQKIRVGNTLSASAGTCVNTQQGDAIELVYRSTGTTWFAANNIVGAWTTT